MSGLHDLEIEDLVVGTGELAERSKTVSIHYIFRLRHGEQVGSSRDDGAPFTFTIGKRTTIAGLERGVVGMRVGGQRVLRVPPHLGYGTRELQGIPRSAILLIEVELLAIIDPA